ncbi:MAG TPA: DUF2997 domain-containing protein [Phycisphaerae bacterium]|nr:DUF2997 domain-containing protein [Phycisphaerae bacterium]HUX16886.1 DUF2997 domain-containing protein [Phycisphaerae bacterium]
MRTIEITVDPAGEVTVRTRGYAGRSCLDASRALEEALGERTAETRTAEFYEARAAAGAREREIS